MNDWLDYQGSGSSRAYTNNTLSHASGFPTGSKQYDADDRLINAYAEKMKKLKSEYKTILNDYNRSMKSYYNYMNNAGSYEGIRASSASKSGHPLKATQNYEKWIWEARKKASDAKSEADSYHAQMKVNVDDQKKLLDDVKAIDVSAYQTALERDSMKAKKANSIFIPYEVVSYPNPNQRIKQSYFDMPADDFIEHAAKERVRFRDSINDTIGKVMDKVTDADHKASDAKNKQREAEERLEAALISRKGKEICDAADKLRRDASAVRMEASDYRTKLDNTWKSLIDRESRAKDPRALAQLNSAKRNISNDVIRTRDKLSSEIQALYQEKYRIRDMYDYFVYNYPTAYVTPVPSSLQDSKKYLDEASKMTDAFIVGGTDIW